MAETPPLRPDSVRRTMTLDATFTDEFGGPMHFSGRCRDLLTVADGRAVLAEDTLEVGTSRSRAVESAVARVDLAGLVGVRAGGGLRKALAGLIPAEQAAGTPLALLLDDLAGASLVAPFAWSRWDSRWHSYVEAAAALVPSRTDVCSGWREGTSALDDRGVPVPSQFMAPVPELGGDGWHELPVITKVSHRRARRIDLWREDGDLVVETHFQDSLTEPDGSRIAVHEYLVTARARDGVLASVAVDPLVLPYDECTWAIPETERVIGVPLRELRSTVLQRLPGVLGCTHLNDLLRSLAEVPLLAGNLPR